MNQKKNAKNRKMISIDLKERNGRMFEFSKREIDINNCRTNIRCLLLTLYNRLEAIAEEREEKYENYHLIYRNHQLEVLGCTDIIRVKGEVILGESITNYGHLPYYWLNDIKDSLV